MLALRVDAVTGHYAPPGVVTTLGVAVSYPIAPPSTVRGFVESMCAQGCGTFRGHIAYGWRHRPDTEGRICRHIHVCVSGDVPNAVRPVLVETLFDPSYIVLVDAPEWEAKIRESLAGTLDRYGTLYLGESSDQVTWTEELTDSEDWAHTEWVTPGPGIPLPIKSGRGYDDNSARYATFNIQPGEPAWISF
jgi:CRISPR-associated Cas5-like protein